MSLLIQNRQTAGPVSPRISRIVACLLVAGMLVNGLVPRFAIDGNSRSVLAGVLSGNSLLLQYFSLSVLPLAIVDSLFKERSSGARPDAPREQNERSSNPSSDFSLINGDTKISPARNAPARVPLCGLAAGAHLYSFAPEARAPDRRAFPPPVVTGLVLLCYFLFARSSVNEDAVTARHRHAMTRFR